ncbi:unnamed protein product [Pleuronectes platessa]|uniref:Uncharacterized protein n=1 Tax=Pleuronectes platessa TaxID=8262 RepID=A0A9N7YTX6_PLEPL|nr:unnamed protein product [Pleuronectes platessa]
MGTVDPASAGHNQCHGGRGLGEKGTALMRGIHPASAPLQQYNRNHTSKDTRAKRAQRKGLAGKLDLSNDSPCHGGQRLETSAGAETVEGRGKLRRRTVTAALHRGSRSTLPFIAGLPSRF